jgi:23S rRNA pseudouridine2605 synthase
MSVRLQKVLSQAGVASRRASEELIRQGRVEVNGRRVTEMGVKVDPERDEIAVDGRQIELGAQRRYVMLHKPRGCLSVLEDQRGRRAVIDLVPDARGLYPAGRLDYNSEGLLLLTDDGPLTQRLTHPRYEHEKEYLVLVRGEPELDALRALRAGIELEDGKTAPAQVGKVEQTPWGRAPRGQVWLRFVLREGRKRQIRRMCDAVGWEVRRLIRVRIGPLWLGDLESGQYRALTADEVRRLKRAAGLN